jgi:hypothetical protein
LVRSNAPLLGGTMAVGDMPSIMAEDVDVGIGVPPIRGPLGNTTPISFETADTNLALGDTGLADAGPGTSATYRPRTHDFNRL